MYENLKRVAMAVLCNHMNALLALLKKLDSRNKALRDARYPALRSALWAGKDDEMAGWKFRHGNPEWHEVFTYRETLKDGTAIEAYTEDCDGDVEYWGVKEDGFLVAFGSTDCSQCEARLAAERVICFGATAEQRMAAMAKTDREAA